jgi:hypothetical protein
MRDSHEGETPASSAKVVRLKPLSSRLRRICLPRACTLERIGKKQQDRKLLAGKKRKEVESAGQRLDLGCLL